MVASLGQLQILQAAADVYRLLLQSLVGSFQLLLALQDGAQLLLDLILLTSVKHGHVNNRLKLCVLKSCSKTVLHIYTIDIYV